MKTKIIHREAIFLMLSVMLFIAISPAQAQTFENLNSLEGHSTKTYYSTGAKVQAETMAVRCDSVISFYYALINFKPAVTLLVLSPDDWPKYTDFPVYGMPHYNDPQFLVVASEDNTFWKSFIPPLDILRPSLSQEIASTYSDQKGELTMQAFFDLLAIHELGHAFHIQGGLKMQRNWMGELFANIFLHTYIATKEPEMLPALTVFPTMVVNSTNKEDLKYTTLNELEANYELIGKQYPKNYGWYQCRWHMAAANIYENGGIVTFQNLWELLKNQKEPLDDKAFAELLLTIVDQSVADVPLKWEEEK
ncbi:hypothetical protein G3O08_12835 [Cryomorpha ignava]|uniref:Zinc-dependent peptidase n=1 Tax=Cryomorpha ignava TaxID=101383 RepID=A0A7K3WRT9_9FLAO|nr:hypothetical protein [Cryomorpha ignava]NEN24390.1 hypothetical protein [Cryomorpha ignava]